MADSWDQISKFSIPEDDPYSQVPPFHRGTVRQMVEGRMQPPTGAALRSPETRMLVDHANKVDPEFDSNTWVSRTNSVKDFASGKSSDAVRSINQALDHTKALIGSMDALGNYQYPGLNAVRNYVNSEGLGKKEITNFKTYAHAVAEEMSKVYKGGNMSDSEIHAWERNLSPNMSPEQHRGAIDSLMVLLHGGIQSYEGKRLQAQGRHLVEKSGPLISKDGLKALNHIEQWTRGTKKEPEAGAAKVPEAGATDVPAAAAAPSAAAGGLPQGWGVEVR